LLPTPRSRSAARLVQSKLDRADVPERVAATSAGKLHFSPSSPTTAQEDSCGDLFRLEPKVRSKRATETRTPSADDHNDVGGIRYQRCVSFLDHASRARSPAMHPRAKPHLPTMNSSVSANTIMVITVVGPRCRAAKYTSTERCEHRR